MRQLFHDCEHLLRMAGLFVIGTTSFFVVRAVMIPDDFGLYGHYRAGALTDNAARQPVHAGQARCKECHEDVFAERSEGNHEAVRCEACHGPLAAHATDPVSEVPELPSARHLCVKCHEWSSSKPSWFPQVVATEHAEGESCDSCHAPHQPGFE